jgi:hypothetical protein
MSALTNDKLALKRVVWVVATHFYEHHGDDPDQGFILTNVEIEGVFSSEEASDKKILELKKAYEEDGGVLYKDFGFTRRKMTVEK